VRAYLEIDLEALEFGDLSLSSRFLGNLDLILDKASELIDDTRGSGSSSL
jgi:hypothetical protein